MTDRRRRPVALFVLLALVVGRLPARGRRPERVPGSRSPVRPTPTPTPSGPTPGPTFVPPTPTPGPTYMPYVVVPGRHADLDREAFKTTPRSIAFWNRALYPSLDPERRQVLPEPDRDRLGARPHPGLGRRRRAEPARTRRAVPDADPDAHRRRRPLAGRVAVGIPDDVLRRTARVSSGDERPAGPADRPDRDGPRPSRRPELAARKNERYAEAIRRHGGRPLLIDGTSSDDEREAAFAGMDGLLLTGGTDIDPARYGRPNTGSRRHRARARCARGGRLGAAAARDVPVFGVCRGFQAINVFAGGTLIQDVAGHAGPAWSTGPAKMHPIRIDGGPAGDRLGADPGDAAARREHLSPPGRRADDLAPGLVATAWAAAPTANSSRRWSCRAIDSSSASSAIPNERNSARPGSSGCGPRSSRPRRRQSRPASITRWRNSLRPLLARRAEHLGRGGPPRGSGRHRGSRRGWRCPGRIPSRGSR